MYVWAPAIGSMEDLLCLPTMISAISSIPWNKETWDPRRGLHSIAYATPSCLSTMKSFVNIPSNVNSSANLWLHFFICSFSSCSQLKHDAYDLVQVYMQMLPSTWIWRLDHMTPSMKRCTVHGCFSSIAFPSAAIFFKYSDKSFFLVGSLKQSSRWTGSYWMFFKIKSYL